MRNFRGTCEPLRFRGKLIATKSDNISFCIGGDNDDEDDDDDEEFDDNNDDNRDSKDPYSF